MQRAGCIWLFNFDLQNLKKSNNGTREFLDQRLPAFLLLAFVSNYKGENTPTAANIHCL
jgi:hypothetical protein